MNITKFFIFFLVIVSLALPVAATSNGFVNASDGSVVVGARVTIQNATYNTTTVTNTTGYYALTVPVNGTYNYNVTRIGYTTLSGSQVYNTTLSNVNHTMSCVGGFATCTPPRHNGNGFAVQNYDFFSNGYGLINFSNGYFTGLLYTVGLSIDGNVYNASNIGMANPATANLNMSNYTIYSAKNVSIGTSTIANPLTISTQTNDALPALGANGGKLGLFYNMSYGMLFGVLLNGNGFIQTQRIDGTPTAYDLSLQPNGGNVGIGTTSPASKLVVVGNTNISAGNLSITTSGKGIVFPDGSFQTSANKTVGWSFGGTGSAITVPDNFSIVIPTSGTIRALTVIADKSTATTFNVTKASFPAGGAAPSYSDITGGNQVVMTNVTTKADSTLAGWTTSLSYHDILFVNVFANNNATELTFQLEYS